MKIALGSDHSGIKLKKIIQEHFNDIVFEDVGAYTEESTDYPDWISRVGKKIQDHETDLGIVICGTGIGASIVANKMKGIRAALCHNSFTAEMAKRHNNANVLALGCRVISHEVALDLIKIWLETSFDGGRHQLRLDKITALETAQK